MAKVTKPAAVGPKARGRYVVADTRWGRVVKAWPRPRSSKPTPYEFYHRKEFGIAAALAAHPNTLDYQFAASWCQGTNMVPRDILTSCAMGLFYEFEGPDLPPFESWRTMSNNPQYWLDLITDVVGSLLVRAEIGWVAVEPGDAGQVLTMENGLPVWKPGPSAPGTATQWTTTPNADYSTSLHATKGAFITPGIDMTVTEIAFALRTVANARYIFSIFHLSGYTIDGVIWQSDEWTAPSAADQWKVSTLPSPVVLQTGHSYALTLTRTDATATTSVNSRNATTDPSGILLNSTPQYVLLDSVAPAVGNTFSHGSTPYTYGLHWHP